jgi:hypothetical protein
MLKRKRVNGKSYLVNDDNKIIAKSFSNWSEEQSLKKEIIKKKREYVLRYISDEPDNKFFILYGGTEIYLTNLGEDFVNICQHVTSNKKKKIIKVNKNNDRVYEDKNMTSIEKLATVEEDKKDLIAETNKLNRMFAEMSSETTNPFSINKCYVNPINNDKRVFFDLYRRVGEMHEGYIVLSGSGSLNAVLAHVVNTGRYMTLKKLYGDNARVYVVAPKFSAEDQLLLESSFVDLCCVTIAGLVQKLYNEARKYYTDGDAAYKLERWENDYVNFFQSELNEF